jgi:hypothetical protein
VHELEDTGVIDSVEKAGLVDNTTESTSWIPNVTSKINIWKVLIIISPVTLGGSLVLKISIFLILLKT